MNNKTPRKTKVKVKDQTNDGDLTAQLNQFAARSENTPPNDLPVADAPPQTSAAAEISDETAYKRKISSINRMLFDQSEDRAFHPHDLRTEIAVDSIEASVGYTSLIRQMHKAFVRRVAYHRSPMGGSLSIEEARALAFRPCANREEALEEFDTLMSLPVEHLNFVDLENLYAAAPRVAEGFWEITKSEGRAEFESGHLAANITLPEDYMKGLWNIARYLGVRESFADDWQPKGGIEIAMLDMLAQSWFQWQYWLEQTVRRSETRERETHPEYDKWLAQRGRELKHCGMTDGYWTRPLVSEQQAIEHAVQMADRFNRIFMRTLRQLRDLRRYAPVTINNPQQVNIAADGGQQVNVKNQEISNAAK